jgi:hypothetical protein
MFHHDECKPVATPFLTVAKNDVDSEALRKENNSFPLRSLVGSMQYLCMTCRPDIAWAVNKIAQKVANPTELDVKRGKHLLKYLKGTLREGVKYSPQREVAFRRVYGDLAKEQGKTVDEFVGFCDADFAGCLDTLKSTSGLIIYFRGTAVCWSSKRQSLRATSTCEAEYTSMYDLLQFSTRLGCLDWFGESEKMSFFNDNKSALTLSQTSLATKRSKHFLLRLHEIRDHARKYLYVPSLLNRADPLTKAVLKEQYVSIFLAWTDL